MRRLRPSLLALALAVPGGGLSAQSAPVAEDGSVAEFVRRVRAATARYQDQALAIVDGFRRVGPDFPSMGEHWISVPRIVSGRVDPLQPPILEYATLDGRPTLVGIAYTQLVRSGSPDASLPVGPEDWHYHAGTVSEESFILGHAGGGQATATGEGPRIAVLHAWIWADNPAGMFATDNWALPYLRLALPVPADAGPTPASLALALAAGGEGYFQALLELRHHPPPEEARAMQEVLGEEAGAIRRLIASGERPDAEALTARWSEIERSLRAQCSSCGTGDRPLLGEFAGTQPARQLPTHRHAH